MDSRNPTDHLQSMATSLHPGSSDDAIAELLEDLQSGSLSTSIPVAVDRLHRRLLSAGIGDEQARLINGQVLELLKPRLPRISNFELFLTRWCNLDCSYCFVHNKRGAVMAGPILEKSLSLIQAEIGDGPGRIVFMGGEPTSQFRAIRRVVECLSHSRVSNAGQITYDITSNGTLIDEPMMEFFSANRVKVLLSIDGGASTHDRHRRTKAGLGSFELIRERLPMIRKYQPYLGSKVTISPESASCLLDDVQLLVSLGIRKLILGHATGVDWTAAARAELASQLLAVLAWSRDVKIAGLDLGLEDAVKDTASCSSDNRWGCRAGVTGVAIDVDGAIYPCSKTIGTAHRQMLLGDVEQGIVNTELRMQLCGFTPSTRTGCSSCQMSTVCKGGCYAVNAESTGNPFSPAPIECHITSDIFKAYNAADGGSRPTTNYFAERRGNTHD